MGTLKGVLDGLDRCATLLAQARVQLAELERVARGEAPCTHTSPGGFSEMVKRADGIGACGRCGKLL